MRGVRVEAGLQAGGALREGAGCGAVPGEQHRGGEISDQCADFAVQWLAVEERQVEQEARLGAEGGQGLGEDGGERHGRGQPVPPRRLAEQPHRVGVEPPVAAHHGGGAGGLRWSEGELRCGREIGQPSAPVVLVRLVRGQAGRRGARRPAVGEVARVAVAERGRRFLGPTVQPGQVAEQDAQAQRVGGDHVQVDVHPGATRLDLGWEQGELNVEDLACRDVQTSVGEPSAQLRQFQLSFVGREFTQVVHPQAGPGARRRDLLAAVVEDPRAEHAVPGQYGPYRRLQAGRVDAGAVELVVEVRCHAAELLLVGAPYPVGVLHQGQLEGGCFVDRLGRSVGQSVLALARDAQLGDQCVPGAQGRFGGEFGEADLQPRPAQAARQPHHGERVQTELDEVGVFADLLGRQLQQFRDDAGQIGHGGSMILRQVRSLSQELHVWTAAEQTGGDRMLWSLSETIFNSNKWARCLWGLKVISIWTSVLGVDGVPDADR